MADDWIGAATAQLDRLRDERHYGKMRATIIALVGARLAGESEETVWEPRRAETCSQQVYQSKWKKAAAVCGCVGAGDGAGARVCRWASVAARQQAAERPALASPVAVATAVGELRSDDPAIRLRAAFGILDRAGIETAPKWAAMRWCG